jgi:RNA polymerase sigma-70 factor (ECF subfamily)
MDNTGFNDAINYLDDIYRVAFYMMENADDAEDLVQEVYIKAFSDWHKFTPGTDCKAWLFKVLYETRLSLLKNGGKATEDTAQNKSEETSPIPLKKHVELASNEGIKKAFTKIPAEYLDALLLHWAADFSYAEIAGILDCPVEKVISRIYSARNLLSKDLSDNLKIK